MKAQLQNNSPGEPVDATPAVLPGPVTLQGRFGSIEKLVAEKHGPALWPKIEGHDQLWAYMKTGPFANEAAFIALLAERSGASDPCGFTILDLSGAPVGLFSLMSIRPEARAIEVGNVVYSPILQRTPLGTEAQYLLMKHAFEALGYRRYEWKCNALNAKSRVAAERLGFVFEGIHRQADIVKGRNRDTAWFSIIDSEWPALKAHFERWLAPDNFGADGKQKISLQSVVIPAKAGI
jgi:RimJ/RimL family protein N-acetyltransferase